MAENAKQRVVVVGAGVVGMSIALHLQSDGHEVVVVDRLGPGEGCSRGNAGVIETGSVLPLAAPGTLRQVPRMLLDPMGPLAIRWSYLPRLTPWLLRFVANARRGAYRRNAAALAAILGQALPAYDTLLGEIQARELFRHTGWLWAYRSRRQFERDRPAHRLRREYGVRVEMLQGEAVRRACPALTEEVESAVYLPDSAWCVEPYELVRRMVRHFVDGGGTVLNAEVRAAGFERQGVRVETETEPLIGDRLVIAAGAWSARLARQFGDRVPLDTERGYHCMLPEPGVATPPLPVMAAEHKFVITPMQGGLRLAGTAELAGLERPPDYTRAEVLLRNARRLLPGLRSEGVTYWMGMRPTLPDSLPVIGPSPRDRRVFYAFGHQHLGLTLAAITGRMTADWLAGRQPQVEMHAFRADRF